MQKKFAVVTLVLAAGLSAGRTLAMEPEAASWGLLEAASQGVFDPGPTRGGDTQVLISLMPSDEDHMKQPLLVVFPGCGEDAATPNLPVLNLEAVLKAGEAAKRPEGWQAPGPRWRLCPQESAVLVHGQAAQLMLSLDFLRGSAEGLSPHLDGEVHILSDEDLAKLGDIRDIGAQWANLVGRRAPSAHVTVDLYYRIDAAKGQFFRGDYAGVFGRPGPDKIESARPTADYGKVENELPVDLLAFRSTMMIPRQVKDDGGRLFARTIRRSIGSALVGANFTSREDYRAVAGAAAAGDVSPDVADDIGLAGRASADSISAMSTYTVTGRFSTKWSADHSLHPGFGFRVEAWSNDSGFWANLGSDWVQSNGTWTLFLSSSPFYFGHRLRIFYTTNNSYYIAQDINGNGYAWVDPDWMDIPTTFSVGHRYADTDGGAYNGVGEMVDAAMYTWSRLYWNGGINPVRSSPINLIAPNTGLACGGTSPWSCASGQNIWLIAAHASQAQVVSHELGHQLNFKFWNNKRPANAGGSHSLNSCYPGREGMTLFEGFADFLAGWVGYQGRNVADGGFGSGRWALGWDLEQRVSPPSCTNGWQNEVWVARTFWDLHDTRGDGLDILWFNNLGAVPALYLNNGVANNGDYRDMTFYENIYRNAASPGHQGYITDIFNQNRN
jgi:hypothetical protein